MKKPTPRQIKITGISLALVLLVASMSVFVSMAFVPVNYGFSFNLRYIKDIEIHNGTTHVNPPIHTDTDRMYHMYNMHNIITLLNRSGRTTALHQIFQDSGTENVVLTDTSLSTSDQIATHSGNHFIKITFFRNNTQYFVDGTNSMNFRIIDRYTTPRFANPAGIHQIFIPLNRAGGFRQHTFFINTTPEGQGSAGNRATHVFTTWADLTPLADFTRGLELN